MGRYTSYKVKEPAVKRGDIHPVMRGIGCILFAIVPPLSYGTAVLLVNYGISQGWPIPPDWLGTPAIPSWLLALRGLMPIYNWIYLQTNLTANIIFAIAVAVVVFGILSMLYGFLYSLAGPSRYGPTDEPPIRRRVKRYKR
jgi:hypothetical protein